jgi:hypothetical protein
MGVGGGLCCISLLLLGLGAVLRLGIRTGMRVRLLSVFGLVVPLLGLEFNTSVWQILVVDKDGLALIARTKSI